MDESDSEKFLNDKPAITKWILLGFGILIGIGLVVGIIVLAVFYSNELKKGVSKTQPGYPPENLRQGYEDAASLMRNSMNPSGDPCRSFYQYSCGKFISS